MHGARPAFPSPPMAFHPGRWILYPLRHDTRRLPDGWQIDIDRVWGVDAALHHLCRPDRWGELVDGQERST